MRPIVAVVVVVMAGCSMNGPQRDALQFDDGGVTCSPPIIDTVPQYSCSPEFAGSQVCVNGGSFYECSSDQCWNFYADGPCAPPFEVDGGAPAGVVLCGSYRGSAPSVPCTATNVGEIHCVGAVRFQCMPSPDNCWATNIGSQACTVTE